ncbi:MAG: GMC family oxidoreductase [Archangiaceae bacterium]|nr:GMC family oxidoreductase [Archangiaceae bacterium]
MVVIGSGYGGAVMAARLAQAGFQVCVLERGAEYQPGDYPSTAAQFVANTQLELKGRQHGARDAMIRYVVDEEHGALVGCGLGGTSLINAGVVLRPPESVWDDPVWPAGLREDLPRLREGFGRAELQLKPTVASAGSAKARALAHAAHGEEHRALPLAVDATKCNACGDCITGCNRGAKNTLLTNYLPLAVEAGARLFCSIEVTHLERREAGGWRVHLRVGGVGRERFESTALSIDARYVVVAAGALGSTELLLRSRAHGLKVSDQLGRRFSGNGTLLGFTSGVPRAKGEPGPTIETMLDLRSSKQLMVQDTAVPSPLRGAVSLMFGRDVHAWSVTAGDDSRGELSLGEGEEGIRIAWPGAGKSERVAAAHAELERISTALGGTFRPNPMWAALPKAPLLATHPLGGCAMADDAEHGVVNHRGQVFGYEDLYVCDGSTLPGSFGSNPLFTLCALAERCAELFVREHGARAASPRPSPSRADAVGFRFTERMVGQLAHDAAPEAKAPFSFLLTIEWPSLEALLRDPSTAARTFGTVRAPSLSPEPLRVIGGSFQLFVGEGAERRMLHRMELEHGLRIEGVKIIRDDPGPDLWFDTRSLFITVFEHDEPIARGLVQTGPLDLLRQVTTLKGLTDRGLRSDVMARAKFLRLFLGTVKQVYGGLVLPLVR